MEAPKRTFIANRMYDVVSYDEYVNHKELYEPQRTAIIGNFDGKDLVLPIRNKPMNYPGVYPDGALNFFKVPSENDINKDDYSVDNIIDFGKAENMADIINMQNQIRDTQYEILTSPDNIYVPRIYDTNSPAMKCLKEAIIEKRIDINKYKDRFGKNFNNEVRLINEIPPAEQEDSKKNTDISLLKLIRICENLDMKCDLTISDANENIPNPIGRSITVELTGGK